MAFIKKEWKNRLVEFAGRRKLTRVSGSIDNQIVVDVTREEGTVSQPGDAFSETNMNDLENRIEKGFEDAVDKNNILNKEGVEANTEAGKYVADALVVKEINDSLGGVTQLIVDPESGQLTGYKTTVGGADTVFPFINRKEKFVVFTDGSTVRLAFFYANGTTLREFIQGNEIIGQQIKVVLVSRTSILVYAMAEGTYRVTADRLNEEKKCEPEELIVNATRSLYFTTVEFL